MIAAIIQARIGSSRLPGKVLMDIEGKPMLQRVIERVKESRLTNAVLVATPDWDIIKFCNSLGVKNYMGSEYDVLSRYLHTAIFYSIDIIVRITADCPLIDPEIIDKTIRYYLNNSFDYVSNTYPDGLDTEVFSITTLRRAQEATKLYDYDREHVVPYMIRNFKVGKLESGQDFSKYHWSVDTAEDLEFVRWVYRELGENFHLDDIVKLIKEARNEQKEIS